MELLYLYVMFLRGFISAFISFVLMTGSPAQIQGTDSLYRASDLHYFSSLEGESFSQYFDGEPDYINMIIAVNANSRENEIEIYQEWISDIIQEIRQKKFDKLSKTKKINRVKNLLGQTLLTSFEHQSDFSDLFKFGKYNYYTAVSLYTIILDLLRHIRDPILINFKLIFSAFCINGNNHLEIIRLALEILAERFSFKGGEVEKISWTEKGVNTLDLCLASRH